MCNIIVDPCSIVCLNIYVNVILTIKEKIAALD